jgi:hypothetical protein
MVFMKMVSIQQVFRMTLREEVVIPMPIRALISAYSQSIIILN